jgi:hypothetical protein
MLMLLSDHQFIFIAVYNLLPDTFSPVENEVGVKGRKATLLLELGFTASAPHSLPS